MTLKQKSTEIESWRISKKYSEDPERVNLIQVWKTLRKLWPKVKEKISIAKKNYRGKIVSEPKQLKLLLTKVFKNRRRARPIRPDF